MNYLTIPFSEKSNPLGWAMGMALGLFVASAFLIASGCNQWWMLAIHTSPVFPAWFWSLFNLGGDAWVALLILLLFEKQAGQLTSWVLKTWLVGALLAQVIKHVWPMPRPAKVLGLENLSIIDHPPLLTGSMPSGHALAAVSCALIVGYVLRLKGAGWLTLVLVGLTAGLVAWSRVAVGAHWPSDVIAGTGLAFVVVTLTREWERFHSWNAWFQKKTGFVFLIILHVFIAVHLVVPQSDNFWIQFIQFNLSLISLMRAFFLFKKLQSLNLGTRSLLP